MADKGGLDYIVTVQDQFSSTLADFKRQIQDVKDTVSGLGAALKNLKLRVPKAAAAAQQGEGGAAGALGKDLKAAHDEQLRFNRFAQQEAKRFAAEDKANARERDRALKVEARGLKDFQRLLDDNEKKAIQAQKEIDRVRDNAFRQAVAQQKATDTARDNAFRQAVAQQKALDAARAGRAQQVTVARAAEQAAFNATPQGQANRIEVRAQQRAAVQEVLASRGLNAQGNKKQAEEAASQATAVTNGFFDSFAGRLRAFLEFRAFSAVIQGFKSLVTTGIEFNSQLEQASISLAAIFATAGQVRNAQGKLVQGAEAFAAAQGVAADQVAKLRVDAIRTTATFEELLTAFQQGLSPGLAAGLNVDEVRKITVTLTQAASAVGIEGRQFAEEIRSIIGGTGTRANTRLLQLLPQDFNAQVAKAREAGVLFEFLNKTFAQFNTLGEKLGGTFEARLSRVKDSIAAVVAAGAVPFFESLKSLFDTIANELVKIDFDSVTPKPEAIAAFRGVSDGLSAIAREAEKAIRELKAGDIAAIGALLADSFTLAAETIGPAFVLTVRIVNGLARALDLVVRGLTLIFRQFRDIGVPLERVVASIVGMRAAMTLLAAVGTSALLPFAGLVILFGSLQKVVQSATGVTFGFADGIRLASLTVAKFSDQIGINLLRVKILAKAISAMSKGKFLTDEGFLEKSIGADLDALKVLETEAGIQATAINEKIALIFDKASKEARTALFDDPVKALSDLQGEIDKVIGQATPGADAGGSVSGRMAELDLEARARIDKIASDTFFQNRINQLVKDGAEAQTEVLKVEAQIKDMQIERALKAAQLVKLGGAQTDEAKQLAAEIDNLLAKEEELGISASKRVREIRNEADNHALQTAALQADHELQRRINEEIRLGVTGTEDLLRIDSEITKVQEERFLRQIQFATVTSTQSEEAQNLGDQITALARQEENLNFQREQALKAQRLLRQEKDLAIAQSFLETNTLRTVNELAQQGLDTQAAVAQTNGTLIGLQLKRASLEQQLLDLGDQQTEQAGLLADQIERIKVEQQAVSFELEKQRQIVNSPVTAGVEAAFAEFRDTAQVTFQATTDLLKGTVSSFSQFVSQSIIDAFDPTKDTTIQERFAQFLQQIGAQILGLLTQIAIAKAVIAAIDIIGGGGGLSSQISGGIGGIKALAPKPFSEGGMVPFADGGMVPGGSAASGPFAGLPASDTVLGALTPGEVVSPLPTVGKYGADFFEALRQRLIDPADTRALMSFKRPLTPRRPRLQALAQGGQVGGSSAAAGPTFAVLMSDDKTMDSLLSGGSDAFMRFARENQAQLKNALGIRG